MSATVKLNRAKRHFGELTTELQTFFEATPYKVGTRHDSETRKIIYYLTDVTDVPTSVAAICGDVIQTLRSALDYLAYGLWVREAGGQGSPRKVYFPIHDSLTNYSRNKVRQTQGISHQSLSIIDGLQPYRGGNDALWRIHELNNIDKHRLLITVGSSFHSVDIGAHFRHMVRTKPEFADSPFVAMPAFPLFIQPADKLFPLKAGDELFIGAENEEPNPEMNFQFAVLLNEPSVVEGEPITDVLQAMIDEVERIVPLLER